MGMGIASRVWEGTGIKNPFPNTSTHKLTVQTELGGRRERGRGWFLTP